MTPEAFRIAVFVESLLPPSPRTPYMQVHLQVSSSSLNLMQPPPTPITPSSSTVNVPPTTPYHNIPCSESSTRRSDHIDADFSHEMPCLCKEKFTEHKKIEKVLDLILELFDTFGDFLQAVTQQIRRGESLRTVSISGFLKLEARPVAGSADEMSMTNDQRGAS
ncbi:short chain dehydrogenase reductase family protein [Moniliophthora roreri]|nr:short chain dehydrogenase reductase family protein [Moniliophthora roreri]